MYTEWNKATAAAYQRVAQQQLELIGEQCSRKTDQLRRFTCLRKPEEFISLQKDCLSEDLNATSEFLQQMIQTTLDSLDEYSRLCCELRDSTCHTSSTGKSSRKRK